MEAIDAVDFNKCQAESLTISSDENKKPQEIIEGLVDSTETKLPMSKEGGVVSNNDKDDNSTTILAAEVASEVKSESKNRTRIVAVPDDVVNNQTTDVTKTITTTKEIDENENFADSSVPVINAKTPLQKESSNISTRINLQKIFTPATDAEEISPRNRKLYASSAFYSPNLHPTVEDQVELARRISHSLSDISNQKSKGQSMYVNRKKRSVKWVHEGSGIAKMGCSTHEGKYEEESKENTERYNDESIMTTTNGHVPLKLVMNPRGKMQDFNSASENFDVQMGLMSPDKCAELVIALNTQNDKGSELFAKRRRKAEKWVVNEFNTGTQCPSGLPDDHQYHPKSVSPSILSDLDKQLNVTQTPYETASIEKDRISPLPSKYMPTNSMTSHYIDNHQHLPEAVIAEIENENRYTTQQQHEHMPWNQVLPLTNCNRQRNLAYRPNIPQGWKAPSVTLSSELYVPKEIPIESYAPPPTQSTQQSVDSKIDYAMGDKYISSLSHASSRPTSVPEIALEFRNSLNLNNTNNRNNNNASIQSKLQAHSSFPLSSQHLGNNGFMYAPPKQLNLPPNSYQIVPQETGHIPQINFNPSPIPYDKLAKFENPSPAPSGSPRCVYNSFYPLTTPGSNSRIRDVSSSLTPYVKLTPSTSQSVHRYPSALQRYCGASHRENDSRDSLTNCQSFNHPIQVWSTSDAGIRKKPSIGVTAYLPYTDF